MLWIFRVSEWRKLGTAGTEPLQDEIVSYVRTNFAVNATVTTYYLLPQTTYYLTICFQLHRI